PSSCATSVTISSRSTYEKGFDSGRCRSGSLGSSLIRDGSGLVIPMKRTSEREAAPRRYSRCPLWKGWNLPCTMPWFTGRQPLSPGEAGLRGSPGAAGGRILRSRRSVVPSCTALPPLARLLCQRRPSDPREPGSLDDDAGALLHTADPPEEELASAELRLERGAALRGDRDQQAPRGLRVVAERLQRRGETVRAHMRPGEVAVA